MSAGGGDTTKDARRRREHAVLARLEPALRAMADLRPGLGIAVFDGDLRFLKIEVPRPLHTGKAPADHAGKTAFEVYAPPQRDRMIAAYRAAIEGRAEVFDIAFGDRILEGRCAPIRDDDGEVVLGLATTEDVTELRGATKALAASETRLRQVMDAGVEGYWERDLVTGRIFHSARMNAIVGLPAVDTNATDGAWRARTHPDDMPLLAPQYVEVLAGRQEVVDVDFRVRREDGTWRWIATRGKVVARDASGRPTLLAGVVIDIQSRKEAEEALAVSERRLQAALLGSRDGLVDIEVKSGAFFGSPRYWEIVGQPPGSWSDLSAKAFEPFHPDDLERVKARLGATLSGDEEAFDEEFRIRRPDGGIAWIRGRIRVVARDDGGKPSRAAGVISDITELKEARRAARESEARFRTLADSAPVGIFETDARGVNVYLNDAASRMMGMSQGEGRGRGWHEAIHPEDRERVFRDWYAAVAERRPYSSEHRSLKPGGEVAVMRVYADAIRDREGEITGYVGVMIDATAQKVMEQQLAVASRLSALGTLVAGVGHEINNPLSALLAGEGFVLEVVKQLLGRLRSASPPSTEEVAAELGETLEPLVDGLASGARIAQIVKDLAIFGARPTARDVVALRPVLDSALRWLPASLGQRVNVNVEDRGAPDVVGLPGQLSQVLLNLLTNAFKAGRSGETPNVTVRLATSPAGQALLEVVDDGVGMTPEVAARAFDPFFTTRPAGAGRGSGLGLSVCQAIVAAHGGTIAVKTEPGKGSRFTVELPAASPGGPARTKGVTR